MSGEGRWRDSIVFGVCAHCTMLRLASFRWSQQMIAHQDLRPSNVLIFQRPNKEECRIGDLGRASRRGYPAIHDECDFAGARTYSPPELLYGYKETEFIPLRIGCDIYMFGNMVAFLLTGINITNSIFSGLTVSIIPKTGQAAILKFCHTSSLPLAT